jgi:hypothetical protein
MKVDRFTVYQWQSMTPELDIDWPRVQRSLGQECLRWLNEQSIQQCQLIVEQKNEQHSLVAEFYCPRAYAKFLLLKD